MKNPDTLPLYRVSTRLQFFFVYKMHPAVKVRWGVFVWVCCVGFFILFKLWPTRRALDDHQTQVKTTRRARPAFRMGSGGGFGKS